MGFLAIEIGVQGAAPAFFAMLHTIFHGGKIDFLADKHIPEAKRHMFSSFSCSSYRARHRLGGVLP